MAFVNTSDIFTKVILLSITHGHCLLSPLISACDGTAGIEFGWIRDSLMSASSEQEYAAASRARLNSKTLPPIVAGLSEGLSGGWKPLGADPQPWIQV